MWADGKAHFYDPNRETVACGRCGGTCQIMGDADATLAALRAALEDDKIVITEANICFHQLPEPWCERCEEIEDAINSYRTCLLAILDAKGENDV